MPRLPQSLVHKARRISRLLPPILQTTRTLQPAINELRWLTEHVVETTKAEEDPAQSRARLLKLVQRRARGEPLQYILGSQPFGNLDIKCEKGVLIPRPETEAYVEYLTSRLKEGTLHNWIKTKLKDGVRTTRHSALRILDACSGTGCISLLAYSSLRKDFARFSVTGIDISQQAIDLARKNIIRNDEHLTSERREQPRVTFIQRDIFKPFPPSMYDIIISNPPYISPAELDKDTERSVRNWEPRDALVPKVPAQYIPGEPWPQDVFYGRLMELHNQCFAKILLMEVGDASQAIRILQQAVKNKQIANNNQFEIWRDDPSRVPEKGTTRHILLDKFNIPIRGAGKVRAVLIHRRRNFVPKSGEEYYLRRFKPTPAGLKRERDRKSTKDLHQDPQLLDQLSRIKKYETESMPEEIFKESEIPELPDQLPSLRRITYQRPGPQHPRVIPKVVRNKTRTVRARLERHDPEVETILKPMTSGWASSARKVDVKSWTNRPNSLEWKFPDYVGEKITPEEWDELRVIKEKALGETGR